MLRYFQILLLLGYCVSPILGQTETEEAEPTMDFELYDPPSTLVVPENLVYRAKFPFIDIHSHQWRMDTADLSQLIIEMDSINMGIMVNLSGRGGKILKAMSENVAKQFPNRFALFTNINLRSIDDPDYTESTVKQIEYDVATSMGLETNAAHTTSGHLVVLNDNIDTIYVKQNPNDDHSEYGTTDYHYNYYSTSDRTKLGLHSVEKYKERVEAIVSGIISNGGSVGVSEPWIRFESM